MRKIRVLKRQIAIKSPITFLCGSYYTDKASDKRKILVKFISDTYKDSIYPLIVDNFLSDDSIENDDITIEKYEELIANISFVNFIYLESYSSASELGLFTSSSSQSRNIVFYPDNSNLILDKIGYFIKFGILNKELFGIESSKYLALVERFAHGTDYVDEHYYFLNNELPDSIKHAVKKELDGIANKTFDLEFSVDCLNVPFKLDTFHFVYNNSLKKVFLSSRTAFYMLYSLVKKDYRFEEILTLETKTLVDKYLSEISQTILDTAKYCEKINIDDECQIYILNFENASTFINYALYFIKYLIKGMYLKEQKQLKNKKALLCKYSDIFHDADSYLLKEEMLITVPLNISKINKTESVKKFQLFKARKTRNIVTYSENGETFLNAHKLIRNDLERIADELKLYSAYSFAYKEGLNTRACVEKHVKSRHFIKMDIHSFFESMSPSIVKNILISSFENDWRYELMNNKEKEKFNSRLSSYIDLLTLNGAFPIGFVSSPIISEIYLSLFDRCVSDYCKEQGIIYTRYADDMLFSSKNGFNKDSVTEVVENELKKVGLTINQTKTEKIDFSKLGDSIHFIGLNIVCGEDENNITVGRSFIRELIKLKLYANKDDYLEKKIAGLESYFKYNDPKGFLKYLRFVSGKGNN